MPRILSRKSKAAKPHDIQIALRKAEASISNVRRFRRMMRCLICPTGIIRAIDLASDQARIAGQDCSAVVCIGGIEKTIPIRLHSDPRMVGLHNRSRSSSQPVGILFRYGQKEEPQRQKVVSELRTAFDSF